MVKRGAEGEQPNEEEADEDDADETLGERIEEARGVLERLEEIRRDSKEGNQLRRQHVLFYSLFKFNCYFKHDWMMIF